jgi:hypothetical protein
MTFRVGQKVVCIRVSGGGDDFANADWAGLQIGAVYIVTSPPNVRDCMRVAGVTGAWCKTRFRPIVERKTSIEIFTRMLNPSKVDA